MFERTRTCADLVGQQSAGLMGFSSAAWPSGLPCGSASWCDQGRWSLRTHLPWLAALQVLEVPASPPRWGSSMMARTSLAKLSAHEGAESMNRSNAPGRATVGGRQPDEPATMSLRCGWCQSHARPRKWPGSVAGLLYVEQVTTAVVRQQARPVPEARFDALRELMTPPDPPKRPIGFINPEDKSKKTSGGRGKV